MPFVPPPKLSYRPTLPRAMVADGLLSDAQIESFIHVGAAHKRFLNGTLVVDEYPRFPSTASPAAAYRCSAAR